ncbi:hypothetical protein D9M68_818450 [compost metagenome]
MIQRLLEIEGVVTGVIHLQGEYRRPIRCSGQGVAHYRVNQADACGTGRSYPTGIGGQGELGTGIRPDYQRGHTATGNVRQQIGINDAARQIVFVDEALHGASILDMDGQGSRRRVTVVVDDGVLEGFCLVTIDDGWSLVTPGAGGEVEGQLAVFGRGDVIQLVAGDIRAAA